MPKENPSWKVLLKATTPHFHRWLAQSNYRASCFSRVADTLDEFVVARLEDPQARNDFIQALVPAVAKCDEDIYDNPMVAVAFAHLHMLERYRRFWDVLTLLYGHGLLPASTDPVQVLDVGTGPAPSLLAISDFYSAVRAFGVHHNKKALSALQLVPTAVEASIEMVNFSHAFSEWMSKWDQRFAFRFCDFRRLNLDDERDDARYRRAMATDDYDQAVPWQDLYRFRLVVFSNFFTPGNNDAKYIESLLTVFDSMPWGGLILSVGSSASAYDPIYESLASQASFAGVKPFRWVIPTFPVSYTTPEALRIKQHYNVVWNYLREQGAAPPPGFSRDVTDPAHPYHGPSTFALRVFRKGPWRQKRRGRP